MSTAATSEVLAPNAPPPLSAKEPKRFCPVHNFALVTMPRDPADGIQAARGYAEKCPLRKCGFGMFRDGQDYQEGIPQ